MITPYWQAWLMVIVAALSTCIANLLLKKSRMLSTELGFLSSFASPWFLAALIFMIVYLFLFSKALDILPISSAYPVFSGVVFITLILSAILLLGERFQPVQLWGIGAIIFGIVLVAR